ncbi:MAG: hypothetical protein D6715_03910 [Calditrichaeota bacterium]|nr:MAG: hypothetical protein D6715_03910 [Calditrichota bacterium]
MMSLREFLFKSLVVLIALLGLVLLVYWRWGSSFPLKEVLSGVGLAYNNLLLAFVLVRWGLSRSVRQFMISVMGGMFFRILLHFSLMFILIGPFEFKAVPLFSSFIVSYFLFMAFEVSFIHRWALLLEEK